MPPHEDLERVETGGIVKRVKAKLPKQSRFVRGDTPWKKGQVMLSFRTGRQRKGRVTGMVFGAVR